MQLFSIRGTAPPGSDEAAAGASGHDGDGAGPSTSMSGALGAADCAASLRFTIEAEIVPRLMLAHRNSGNDETPPPLDDACDRSEQASELADMLLRRDPADARNYVQSLRQAGMSVETLYLDLLAPAARRLGAMWEADLSDFTQVTVGLWRLQQIVHDHSALSDRGRATRVGGRRALLLPSPGSQHTFGLLLVGEFFRRAGWQVVGDPTIGVEAAKGLLAREPFDLLGLSVGSECHVDMAASAILTLRGASLNPSLVVMVGGPVANLWPDFAERIGADATAADAAMAVAMADSLVVQRKTN